MCGWRRHRNHEVLLVPVANAATPLPLQPANVLFSRDTHGALHLVVGDFGQARVVSRTQTMTLDRVRQRMLPAHAVHEQLSTMLITCPDNAAMSFVLTRISVPAARLCAQGTPLFRAPEIDAQARYDLPADLFSAALVLYCLYGNLTTVCMPTTLFFLRRVQLALPRALPVLAFF